MQTNTLPRVFACRSETIHPAETNATRSHPGLPDTVGEGRIVGPQPECEKLHALPDAAQDSRQHVQDPARVIPTVPPIEEINGADVGLREGGGPPARLGTPLGQAVAQQHPRRPLHGALQARRR